MHLAMQAITKKDMVIPAIVVFLQALLLGVPSAAFAATGASVAPSAMTKLLKNIFCAGAAAVFTVTFIHPIDVVKTRIQVQSNKGE